MRDALLVLAVAGALPFALFRPFFGLLVLLWLGFFRPQELAWTYAREIPFSLVVGVVTVAGLVLGHSRFPGPFSREALTRLDLRTRLMLMFLASAALSALVAEHPGAAGDDLLLLAKSVATGWLVALLATGRTRMRWVLGVIAGSLALLALKALLHVAITDATWIRQGPGGLLTDSNDFALALAMATGLSMGLLADSRTNSGRAVWVGAIAACAIGAGMTRSLSGLVALIAVGAFALVRWRRRFLAIASLAVLAAVILTAIPPAVSDDARALLSGRIDPGSRARLVAGQKALALAVNRPFLGVGPGNFVLEFHEVPPVTADPAIVVHNTWLQVLAENGAIGLVLFLGLALAVIARLLDSAEEEGLPRHVDRLSAGIFAALLAYLAGTVFLSRVHLDLFYVLVGATTVLYVRGGREDGPAAWFLFWRKGGRPDARHLHPDREL